MTSFKLALRELKNHRRFSLLFIFNLAIGLFGFVSLDGFKRSFQSVLHERSRNMLTADLSVSARRPISEEERQIVRQVVGNEAKQQDVWVLFSMVSVPATQKSQLVELKAVEDTYPFYGSIQLKNQGPTTGSDRKAIIEQNRVWLAPEIMIGLGVQVGDELKIGQTLFTIDDVIEDDTSMSWAGAAFAPRIYIGLDRLQDAGLVQEGSTIWRRIYYQLPASMDPNLSSQRIFQQIESPAIRVRSHLTAGENDGRLLAYLTDYLGLVSLVAFFLSGLGAVYLFRGYLIQKHREIAILLSLGMTHVQAVLTYSWQILILGVISASLSSLVGWLVLPITGDLIQELAPIRFTPIFSWETVIVAMLMGAIGTLLLCIPLLAHIRRVSPGALFQEVYQPSLDTDWRSILLLFPAISGFYALSVWQARSWLVGSLFFGLLMISSLILAGFAVGSLKGLKRWPKRSLSSRLAIRYLYTHKVHAIACFLALSLGSLLINLIPQVRQSLLAELEQPAGLQLPSLFLFDIQEDQRHPLEELFSERDLKLKSLSPMVSGRLTEINNQPFDKGDGEESFSREARENQRMRNRGVNLSYRLDLSETEELTAGVTFSGVYNWETDVPAEVSLEVRYAQRMGLKIGDELSFDVQGVPINAKVVSLRSIKWNSFQPNFFIQFQPGVLEDAPKTYLASVPPLPYQEKQSLQAEIANLFPNVSVIDVTRLVEKVAESIGQMSLILQIMAWISIAAGMVVVFSIAVHQAQTRRWDVNLLKILGASFKDIQFTILKEFGILSLGASLLGGILGIAVSYGITTVLFDGLWRPDLLTPFLCMLIVITACLVIASLATRTTLKSKPAWIVNEGTN
ncbi:MAG: ABC transporter permease [Oligoflexus sp.]